MVCIGSRAICELHKKAFAQVSLTRQFLHAAIFQNFTSENGRRIGNIDAHIRSVRGSLEIAQIIAHLFFLRRSADMQFCAEVRHSRFLSDL